MNEKILADEISIKMEEEGLDEERESLLFNSSQRKDINIRLNAFLLKNKINKYPIEHHFNAFSNEDSDDNNSNESDDDIDNLKMIINDDDESDDL